MGKHICMSLFKLNADFLFCNCTKLSKGTHHCTSSIVEGTVSFWSCLLVHLRHHNNMRLFMPFLFRGISNKHQVNIFSSTQHLKAERDLHAKALSDSKANIVHCDFVCLTKLRQYLFHQLRACIKDIIPIVSVKKLSLAFCNRYPKLPPLIKYLLSENIYVGN